ncbi:MAG: RidA family protein [Clostridia bacterium]|jgi:2-iminobutanoate/2-iminopropanoate deaminase|nr:RidA family protein [Clostridia bacterium]NLS85656.1 RidA family protein [Oscillospiraceae bacterium]
MKKVIATDKAPGAIGPYSQAIDTGNIVFCSGQLPIIPETGVFPDGVAAQTRQCLKNADAVLKAAGLSLADVVKTTVYLQHMEDFAVMNGVYEAAFTGTDYPARSAVEVAKLPKNALVEIEVIALRS